MFFASPWWLLALVPWGALVAYLLWGRTRRVRVPFLKLWEIPDVPPPPRRSVQLPPLAVMLMLLAILGAIVSAASPRMDRTGTSHDAAITLIIDRGRTMSASGRANLRFRELTRQVEETLLAALGPARVEVMLVPGQDSERVALGNLSSILSAGPTAINTRDALASLVAQRLENSADRLIVLTDHSLQTHDRRVIHVAPSEPFENVSIVHVAMRDRPRPQLLLRLRNESSHGSASVSVTHLTEPVTLELPPAGQVRDYFIDLPEPQADAAPATQESTAMPPGAVHVEIAVSDALALDNHAWLVRQHGWPRVETRTEVSLALARLIDAYTRLQPPDERSPSLWIVGDPADLPADQPGVILTEGTRTVHGAPTPVPHPINAHVQWERVFDMIVSEDPPAGWTPLLRAGDLTVLAVRESPVRQVWIGFDSRRSSTLPHYPVFWKNVFDYVGQGGVAYVHRPPGQLPSGWRLVEGVPDAGAPDAAGLLPGLYRGPGNTWRAINALDVTVPTTPPTQWQQRLRDLPAADRAAIDLRGPILLASLALVVVAALAWRSGQPALATPRSATDIQR